MRTRFIIVNIEGAFSYPYRHLWITSAAKQPKNMDQAIKVHHHVVKYLLMRIPHLDLLISVWLG